MSVRLSRFEADEVLSALSDRVGEATSPALDRAMTKLDRSDRPTFTDEEAAALYGELLNAIDGCETDFPPALERALDKLEAAQ